MNRFAALLLLVLLATGAAGPSSALAAPAPAEARLEELLAALRAGDEDGLRTLVSEAFAPPFRDMAPMEMHLEQLGSMSRTLGDFSVEMIQVEGERAEMVLRTAPGDLYDIGLEVEPGPPHRIAGVDFKPHDEDLILPEFTELSQVDAFLRGVAEQEKFGGVVLVERPGQPRFMRAYGLANHEAGIANTPKTSFDVGSITKSFTAVGILQLVESGKVELDAPLSRYLKGFPKHIAEKVTIRHLLRMESGYGDYFSAPGYRARRGDMKSLDDMLAVIRKMELEFEPGTDERYSNAGYAILGGVIERVSGLSYPEYVRRHVFEPAGMTGSGFPSFAERGTAATAVGYTRDGGDGLRRNLDLFPETASPAGGSFSTAEDLARFVRALRGDKLLSPKWTDFALTRFAPGETRRPVYAVAGGAPGVSAVLLYEADMDVLVVVLSNHDEPFAERVGVEIFNVLRGR